MRAAVNSHALPIYKKNRIASLLCIFETIIQVSTKDFGTIARLQTSMLWYPAVLGLSLYLHSYFGMQRREFWKGIQTLFLIHFPSIFVFEPSL